MQGAAAPGKEGSDAADPVAGGAPPSPSAGPRVPQFERLCGGWAPVLAYRTVGTGFQRGCLNHFIRNEVSSNSIK